MYWLMADQSHQVGQTNTRIVSWTVATAQHQQVAIITVRMAPKGLLSWLHAFISIPVSPHQRLISSQNSKLIKPDALPSPADVLRRNATQHSSAQQPNHILMLLPMELADIAVQAALHLLLTIFRARCPISIIRLGHIPYIWRLAISQPFTVLVSLSRASSYWKLLNLTQNTDPTSS